MTPADSWFRSSIAFMPETICSQSLRKGSVASLASGRNVRCGRDKESLPTESCLQDLQAVWNRAWDLEQGGPLVHVLADKVLEAMEATPLGEHC